MTVFLTPDCVPFYGGTYYPPEDRTICPDFGECFPALPKPTGTSREIEKLHV